MGHPDARHKPKSQSTRLVHIRSDEELSSLSLLPFRQVTAEAIMYHVTKHTHIQIGSI